MKHHMLGGRPIGHLLHELQQRYPRQHYRIGGRPVTAEFVNIGVALYAPAAKYLNAICTSHYQRLSTMFEPIDGEHFRQITRFI